MKAFADLIAAYLNNPGTVALLKEKKGVIIKKLNDVDNYIRENPKGTLSFIDCIYQALISHVKSGKINSESIKKIDEFAKKLGTEEGNLFAKNMRALVDEFGQNKG